MGDALPLGEATPLGEAAEMGLGRVGTAQQRHVLGDRQQQRTVVGISWSQEGIDFEHGTIGSRRVDEVAVVDHALEHRDRPDPHRNARVGPGWSPT